MKKYLFILCFLGISIFSFSQNNTNNLSLKFSGKCILKSDSIINNIHITKVLDSIRSNVNKQNDWLGDSLRFFMKNSKDPKISWNNFFTFHLNKNLFYKDQVLITQNFKYKKIILKYFDFEILNDTCIVIKNLDKTHALCLLKNEIIYLRSTEISNDLIDGKYFLQEFGICKNNSKIGKSFIGQFDNNLNKKGTWIYYDGEKEIERKEYGN